MQPGLFWRIWAVIRSWFPSRVQAPDLAFSEADLAAVRAVIEKPFDWLASYGRIWHPGSTAFWLAPTAQTELDAWHETYSGKRIGVENIIHQTHLKAKKKAAKSRAKTASAEVGTTWLPLPEYTPAMYDQIVQANGKRYVGVSGGWAELGEYWDHGKREAVRHSALDGLRNAYAQQGNGLLNSGASQSQLQGLLNGQAVYGSPESVYLDPNTSVGYSYGQRTFAPGQWQRVDIYGKKLDQSEIHHGSTWTGL